MIHQDPLQPLVRPVRSIFPSLDRSNSWDKRRRADSNTPPPPAPPPSHARLPLKQSQKITWLHEHGPKLIDPQTGTLSVRSPGVGDPCITATTRGWVMETLDLQWLKRFAPGSDRDPSDFCFSGFRSLKIKTQVVSWRSREFNQKKKKKSDEIFPSHTYPQMKDKQRNKSFFFFSICLTLTDSNSYIQILSRR